MQDEAHEVGGDDDAVARQAVGDHAADEHEGDEREAVGAQDEAEVGRAAGEVDDEERQRDGDDVVAHDARGLPEPEQAEVPVTQDAQELRQAEHGRSSVTCALLVAGRDSNRRGCARLAFAGRD